MTHHSIGEELSAILGALVGGARYGFKIRVPHALVMTILFRHDLTSKEKIHSVLKLAFEHASNLAAFASIYKSILALLKWSSRHIRRNEKLIGRTLLRMIVDGPFEKGTHNLPPSLAGEPDLYFHALIGGAVGGYIVWGRHSSVNQQIVLYLTSRVIVGLAKLGWERIHGTPHHESSILNHPKTYPLLAATVWGIVMVLFESSPHVLHRSLRQSMQEIYRYQLSTMSTSSEKHVTGD